MKRKNEPWPGSERDCDLRLRVTEMEHGRQEEIEGIGDNEIMASARERIMKSFSKALETIEERNRQVEAQELVCLITFLQ
jgi:hypothetical protein